MRGGGGGTRGARLVEVHEVQHTRGDERLLGVDQSVQQAVHPLVHVERRRPHRLMRDITTRGLSFPRHKTKHKMHATRENLNGRIKQAI